MKRPSLHKRLVWLAGVPVIVLYLLAGAWLAQRTAHETREMFDRELQRTAASVLAVVAALPDGSPAALASADGRQPLRGQRPEIVVRNAAGRVLLDASTLPAGPPAPALAQFHTLKVRGENWRMYQRWDTERRYWVQVAAPLHDREELLAAHVGALLVPLAGLLLLLPLAIWLALRRGLAPLRKLSRAVAAQPTRIPLLSRADVPKELLPLTRALDALVANLNAALQRERRFTADAAHELRHPLAVLQMELDLAAVQTTGTNRATHLQRARAGLERMERLVAQLLTLARVESLERMPDAAEANLAELAREIVAEAGVRAAPRDIRLALHADPQARMRVSPGLLGIALRNLVDNAIAHGRPQGEVRVNVTRRGEAVEIAVDDDGPGIGGEQAARAGERFLRGQDSAGSGLGLSIVHAIAALHGGGMTIDRSDLGGARVVLRLPLLPASMPA